MDERDDGSAGAAAGAAPEPPADPRDALEEDEVEVSREQLPGADFDKWAFALVTVDIAIIGLVWLIWRLSWDQLMWIIMGLLAISEGWIRWHVNPLKLTHHTTADWLSDKEAVRVNRPSKPSGNAFLFKILLGLVLICAGTPTVPGRWIASIAGPIQTVQDAVTNVPGLILTVIFLPILALVPLVVAVCAIGATLWGLRTLITLPFRRGRLKENLLNGLGFLLGGLFALGMLGMAAYNFGDSWDQMVDLVLEPYRDIASWF
ncbi:hypothetical protein GA0070624_5596 [Micromonospora rhizosphaerae]|uniref:Uncharacterized protein n=1 Tax=Micromonospora rhizosphaerae TaxID=568872 RepID=A0A1C6T4T7_9ACTN|nr:hypothetical protein [Micromonospora rhizosphaerae]SCL36592.1 hypothetical protein GA0070624_5596 [Micromonospora rhizosphaerae]